MTTCTDNRIPYRVCPVHGACHRCGGTEKRTAPTQGGVVEVCAAPSCHPPLRARRVVVPYIVVAIPVGTGSCPACGGVEVWPILQGLAEDGTERYGWICARCYPPPAHKAVQTITAARAA